jgi:hypothetical protein
MRRRRATILVPVALVVLAAIGCTDDGGPDLPSANNAAPAGTTAAEPRSPLEHEREFIACMRGEDVDITDPIPGDTSGRSAVKHELDVNGQGSNPAFQAALEVCMHLLPPPPPEEPADPQTVEQLREFAQCMRDNGVPDYPDPDDTAPAVGPVRVPGEPSLALEKCRQVLAGPGATPASSPGG